MDLEFALHPAQQEIFEDPNRFKVVAAGRRGGKTYLARVKLIIEALLMENKHGYDLTGKAVYYIAPTFQMAKDIMWQDLCRMAEPVTKGTRQNECVLTLVNDRRIFLKGSDNPDALRGVGLSYAVLDEYAFMKPETWIASVRPMLSDVKGEALFIGTPNGKNHFYDLYVDAATTPDWAAFTFPSVDNPFLDPEEILAATKDMPLEYVKQEFEANFASFGGTIFQMDLIETVKTAPEGGEIYMAIDPAGYAETSSMMTTASARRLDETAIAIVNVSSEGWTVLDIVTGRWGVRETSLRILREAQKHKPLCIGIEKGALKNAIMPYLHDQMKRLNVYPRIIEVSHGNKDKNSRIVWALQGRMQNGRLNFVDGPYLRRVTDQLLDFPNPTAHDDMIDALAYIDQVAVVNYNSDVVSDDWEPLDAISGF